MSMGESFGRRRRRREVGSCGRAAAEGWAVETTGNQVTKKSSNQLGHDVFETPTPARDMCG